MKKFMSLAIMLSLLSGKRYSAPQLAEKYETSVKTIYRSIDALLEAGMPIVSVPGKGGGYELVWQSEVASPLFTTSELGLFLSFLKSTNPTYFQSSLPLDERLDMLKDKQLSSQLKNKSCEIVVDTLSWGSRDKVSANFEKIREAISGLRVLKITYGQSKEERLIEPHTLVYKAGLWYLYALCRARGKFRLFRLSRINTLAVSELTFVRKDFDPFKKPWNEDFQKNLELVDISLRCPASIKDEVAEWLDISAISPRGKDVLISGRANLCLGLVHRIMELGPRVEVEEPKSLREAVICECEKIVGAYEKNALHA